MLDILKYISYFSEMFKLVKYCFVIVMYDCKMEEYKFNFDCNY